MPPKRQLGTCECTWRTFFRREVFALVAVIFLWIFLLIAVVAPWYAIAATNLPAPMDSLTATFWWKGLIVAYAPELMPGNYREYTVPWASMQSTLPKNVYQGCVAMIVLSFLVSSVLLIAIFFGLVCRATGRLINILFCGLFKWVLVILSLACLLMVTLSWTLFLMFNDGLYQANLCPGQTAYDGVNLFPVTDPYKNQTVDAATQASMWCCGFKGSRSVAISGQQASQWVYGPFIGWIFAVLATGFIFFVFCVMLTLNPNPFKYEEIGENEEWARKFSDRWRERVGRIYPRDFDDDGYDMDKRRGGSRRRSFDQDDYERQPIRGGGGGGGGGGSRYQDDSPPPYRGSSASRYDDDRGGRR